MFAIIETKGATHIAIHVPHQGAEKSLPALAAMLEKSTVCLKNSYSEAELVRPDMSITLGDTYRVDGYDKEFVIAGSGAQLLEGFEFATPETMVSFAKGIKRRDEENTRLKTELSYTKQELERLKTKVQELSETQEAS